MRRRWVKAERRPPLHVRSGARSRKPRQPKRHRLLRARRVQMASARRRPKTARRAGARHRLAASIVRSTPQRWTVAERKRLLRVQNVVRNRRPQSMVERKRLPRVRSGVRGQRRSLVVKLKRPLRVRNAARSRRPRSQRRNYWQPLASSFLRRSRQSGSRASIRALNFGPCPWALRCVSSWTTTYSTHSLGLSASITA